MDVLIYIFDNFKDSKLYIYPFCINLYIHIHKYIYIYIYTYIYMDNFMDIILCIIIIQCPQLVLKLNTLALE